MKPLLAIVQCATPRRIWEFAWHVLPWLTHSLAPLWHSYNDLCPQQITSTSKYTQQLRGRSRAAQYIHLDTCSTEVLFFLGLGALPPTQNSRSPSCRDVPPTDQPCWWFCLAPPFPILALTNSPLATIAAAGLLPGCGHGCWGGCEHTWPQCHKLSLCTPKSLQTASNPLIHPAHDLKVHFLQRKNQLQKEKCLLKIKPVMFWEWKRIPKQDNKNTQYIILITVVLTEYFYSFDNY